MYKDKNKQKETQRERQRRYRRDQNTRRDKQGVTQPTCDQIVDVLHAKVLANPKVKLKPERTALGNIRVSKPGDADYVPMCEITKNIWKNGTIG